MAPGLMVLERMSLSGYYQGTLRVERLLFTCFYWVKTTLHTSYPCSPDARSFASVSVALWSLPAQLRETLEPGFGHWSGSLSLGVPKSP